MSIVVSNERCVSCSHTESGVPSTGSVNTIQFRPVVDLPEAVSSAPSQSGNVEAPPVNHVYCEIIDNDQAQAAGAVAADSTDTAPKTPYRSTDKEPKTPRDSADTEPSTAYNHLGPVAPRPTQPPVYLQLIDSNVVEQEDVPTTSQTCVQIRAVVTPSQLLDGEGEQVPDSAQ